MDIANVTVGLSFLAGLASFLSPCVFSLVPAYVGYLGGRAAGGETTENNRFTNENNWEPAGSPIGNILTIPMPDTQAYSPTICW